jgi:purine-nucleoside phosphorylase
MDLKRLRNLPPALGEQLEALVPRWSRLELPPGTLGVILGSGLGEAADGFPVLWRHSFAELELPGASVQGHRGSLVLARGEGAPLLFLQGRIHRYEGRGDPAVLLPAAAMAALGIRGMLVTNAAGGMDPAFRAGDFMRIRDILSLQLDDPLRGSAADPAPRSPARRPLFDPILGEALDAAAREAGVRLHEGVLTVALGPAYETPAEIRMARALGAQAASMSTFPECMLLARLGLPLLGMSCITNEIRESDETPLSHEEVVEVGLRSAAGFARLLAAMSRRLAP